MIDLDGQCNLSVSCGMLAREFPYDSYRMLKEEGPAQVIPLKNGVDIIPASPRLADIDVELSRVMAAETVLREQLNSIKGKYDYVLLDCPPGIGAATINAFVAADAVIIPLQAEFLAYHGLSEIIKLMALVKKKLNPSLQLDGIFITRYDRRRILNKHIVKSVERDHEAKFFQTLIRENVATAEAPSKGMDIFSYSPSSMGARDYGKLVNEILMKE